MRQYRLAYVSKMLVWPLAMRSLPSASARTFATCLRARLKRLTADQQEELHALFLQHKTDALTDGTATYTLSAGALWTADFSEFTECGALTGAQRETEACRSSAD